MTALRSLLFVALFYLWSALLAVGAAPICLLGPRRWTMEMMRLWAKGIIALLAVVCSVRVEIRGREHIPAGAAVLAPKHQCMFDVFAQFAWLPRTCFVMKKELTWIPWFGWYAAKVRTIVVDRHPDRTAVDRQRNLDTPTRPLAGVVEEVAEHLLQVLRLASEEQRSLGQRYRDVHAAPRMHLVHDPHQSIDHRLQRRALPGQVCRGGHA